MIMNAIITHLHRASHITLGMTSRYITYTLAKASLRQIYSKVKGGLLKGTPSHTIIYAAGPTKPGPFPDHR